MLPRRRSPKALASSLIAGLLAVGASSAASAAPGFTIAAPPPWVLDLALPTDSGPPRNDVRSGLYYLLIDQQIRVAAGSTARYYRQAWKVLSTAGVQEASEISIEFDPSYQRLTIHALRLWRDGKNVRAFAARDVNVIHKENDLSDRIYNGSLTALVFLKDVRPGDVVDYAYTVSGANPILDGRFVADLKLAYSVPVARLRHRLLWPRERTLHVKAHGTDLAPVVADTKDARTYTWERQDVASIREEDDTPSWFEAHPFLQLDEFSSWNDVARWASRIFQGQDRESPRLVALAKSMEKLPEEERALRAIRFVQDEVRYLGIEMGPSSHQPHPPAQVLEQRFGDCKDKALLLVTLLHRLGIEASPVLVATDTRRALDERQPTPFAFDHVIVLAQIAGASVWIDATRSEVGGRPAAFEPPPFERGLVVREDTTGLATIPAATRTSPTVLVEETYNAASGGASARLAVKTTYRAGDADVTRQSLARSSPDEIAEGYLNHYARQDPGVRALSPPRFQDDREQNVIVGEESYELPGFWKDHQHYFYAWAVGERLHKPATTLRSMPLRVSHPVHVEQRLTVNLPEAPTLTPEQEDFRSDGFVVHSRSEVHDQTVVLTYSYKSLGDSVAAASTRRHLEAMDRAKDALGYTIDSRRSVSTIGAGGSGPRVGLGLMAVLGVGLGVLGIGLGRMAVRSGRRRAALRGLRNAPKQPAGESAATALPPMEALRLGEWLTARACACGLRGRLREAERHTVTYDGQPMDVVTCRCEGCGGELSLYLSAARP